MESLAMTNFVARHKFLITYLVLASALLVRVFSNGGI